MVRTTAERSLASLGMRWRCALQFPVTPSPSTYPSPPHRRSSAPTAASSRGAAMTPVIMPDRLAPPPRRDRRDHRRRIGRVHPARRRIHHVGIGEPEVPAGLQRLQQAIHPFRRDIAARNTTGPHVILADEPHLSGSRDGHFIDRARPEAGRALERDDRGRVRRSGPLLIVRRRLCARTGRLRRARRQRQRSPRATRVRSSRRRRDPEIAAPHLVRHREREVAALGLDLGTSAACVRQDFAAHRIADHDHRRLPHVPPERDPSAGPGRLHRHRLGRHLRQRRVHPRAIERAATPAAPHARPAAVRRRRNAWIPSRVIRHFERREVEPEDPRRRRPRGPRCGTAPGGSAGADAR